MTAIEDEFAFQLDAIGIKYQREYKAIPDRQFRWDFAVYDVLIEIQGGTWSHERSGHSTGSGIKNDCEKLNLATLAGYRSLHFTSDMVHDGSALAMVEKLLNIAS